MSGFSQYLFFKSGAYPMSKPCHFLPCNKYCRRRERAWKRQSQPGDGSWLMDCCCPVSPASFLRALKLLETRQRDERWQASRSSVGWKCKAIRDNWMKEMNCVNRDQKVRELGLEKEALRGNIRLQSQWVGVGEWGRRGRRAQSIHLCCY